MIEYNGLGISRDVLDNVLKVVGKSTNKDDGTVGLVWDSSPYTNWSVLTEVL